MAVYKFLTGTGGDFSIQKDSGTVFNVPGTAEATASIYGGKVRVQTFYPYYEALISLPSDHVEIDSVDITASGVAAIVEQLNDDVFTGPESNITTADDIEITNSSKGLILRSPNGKRWRWTTDNDGTLQQDEIV